MNIIHINHEPVELYKILKFETLVGGGGEAKMVISSGMVTLNGEVETQKRKKIVSGDIIEFNGEAFQIKLGDEQWAPEAKTPKPSVNPVKAKSAAVKKAPKSPTNPIQPEAKKRSAIRF
jgi:ribosome-associated protein